MVEETTTYGVQSMNYHVPSVVDGSGISIREWVPPPEVTTKATLQLTHGIAEHSGRYDRFGRFLAANGYRVYASDLRGHGLSVGQSERGKASMHFWANTATDMEQLLDLMHAENPNVPRFASVIALGRLSPSGISKTGVACSKARYFVERLPAFQA